MSTKSLPTRRVWDVMDQAAQSLVYWLGLLLVVSAIEYSKGSFTVDPFQTYSFVILQAPLHALVVYASMCMMHIGYHLAILGKSQSPLLLQQLVFQETSMRESQRSLKFPCLSCVVLIYVY